MANREVNFCYCSENARTNCDYCAARYELDTFINAAVEYSLASGQSISHLEMEEDIQEIFTHYKIGYNGQFDILTSLEESGSLGKYREC